VTTADWKTYSAHAEYHQKRKINLKKDEVTQVLLDTGA
jgi:hypothetical protein